MTTFTYDRSFMQLAAQAEISAKIIVHIISQALHVSSVADFGCALGTWLAAWQAAGVNDVLGIDGPYVSRSDLRISPDRFQSFDLADPIDLGRRFDLVQSLEVAEHMPEASAAGFVASLVRHSDVILFSAAPPGQGGECHINEQPYQYWRALFASHDYEIFDWLRPQLHARKDIQFWYRYNLFLFVSRPKINSLPPQIRASILAAQDTVPDLSPRAFRLRKAVVRRLPPPVQNGISRTMRKLQGL